MLQMNIFYLDASPKIAAQMQGDKHVVKMILETAQMLSTAHRILDGKAKIVINQKSNRKQKIWILDNYIMNNSLYKATHINHPSSVWIRQSNLHYKWALDHFNELCNEYTHRYGKTHLTEIKLSNHLLIQPMNIPIINDFKSPPCCMPDEYKKTNCHITNYRDYYNSDKKKMHKWTNREKPNWIKDFI